MPSVEELIALYTRADERLRALVQSLEEGSLSRRRKEELLRQIEAIIAELTDEAGNQMASIVSESYRAGASEAVSGMIQAGMSAESINSTLRPLIHQRAAQAIMDDAFYSILEASDYMSADAKRRIEKAVRLANERSLLTGMSRREATRLAVAELNKQGITGMITKNGAWIPADKYMAGVIHYHQRKAHVTGAENMAVQNGIDLVYVNYVGITCEYCAKYQGRVYSISGRDPRFPKLEVRPPYHSHCVHSLTPWIEELTPPEEVERMIKQSNRPFVDNRTEANIRRYNELQREKSRKNATRKQWIRYKAVLPNDTPDLRTFASWKARNTKSYQELQELYRDANRIIKAREDIESGVYPRVINRQKQNRHIIGTKEFEDYRKKLKKDGFEPSILRVDPDEILKTYSGKGLIIVTGGAPKESVKTNGYVGDYFDFDSKEYRPTEWVMIVYSKTGAHVYPKKGDE